MSRFTPEAIEALRSAGAGIGSSINAIAEANGQSGAKEAAVDAAQAALDDAKKAKGTSDAALDAAVTKLKASVADLAEAVEALG